MTRLRSLFAVAWLVTAAACSDSVSPKNGELELNRQKWRANGYRNYTMVMHRVCFCGEVGPYNVIVMNDSVVLATLVSNGNPSDAKRYLPTINKLFDFIDESIRKPVAQIDVTYDATLGYPREINYDGSAGIADDELFYTISDVKPLATTAGVR